MSSPVSAVLRSAPTSCVPLAVLGCLRPAIPCGVPVASLPAAQTPDRGPGVGHPVPSCRNRTHGDDQDLPGSWRILVCLCPALRPRQDRPVRPYDEVGAAPVVTTTKAPTTLKAFEAQSHGFGTRCLRFVRHVAVTHARLASRCWPLCGAGLVTRRIPNERFPSSFLHLFPLSQACLAQCQFILWA